MFAMYQNYPLALNRDTWQVWYPILEKRYIKQSIIIINLVTVAYRGNMIISSQHVCQRKKYYFSSACIHVGILLTHKCKLNRTRKNMIIPTPACMCLVKTFNTTTANYYN